MDNEDEPVEIDGHKVDPRRVDQFYHGRSGKRVTDEEWDVSAQRLRAFEAKEADDAGIV